MTTRPTQSSAIRLGFDPAYLADFEGKLFIEGPTTRRKLVNFFALLLFSTVIATYGVLSGSSATVIGAMIVAPLMGPIMATTAAVVLGSTRRALNALGLTLIGIGTVIAFSALLTVVVPDVAISFSSNPEITSRINPGLLALLTALGSGAAGAFIMSRAEIADSMGGVAIAISLVPPLCVVGIALQQGQNDAAAGALLLFVTNLLAILLAGGITFWLLGLWRAAPDRSDARVRRAGLALFFVGTVLVAIPLTLAAYEVVMTTVQTNQASTTVQEWLQGRSYRVVSVSLREQLVVVTIEGSGDLGPVQTLADQVAATLGHPVVVNVLTIPALIGTSGTP